MRLVALERHARDLSRVSTLRFGRLSGMSLAIAKALAARWEEHHALTLPRSSFRPRAHFARRVVGVESKCA